MKTETSDNKPSFINQAIPIAILVLIVLIIFSKSFSPDYVLFSNDGPLGAQSAKYTAMPDAFTGIWQDLNWLGHWAGNAMPDLTYILLWWLKPLGFSKFYVPIAILVLAFSAWFFFRRLGMSFWTAFLGAIAAAFNTDFFSYACWGLGSLTITVATVFLALAALTNLNSYRGWLSLILAGAAVGLSLMEGFDNGAIFSLYVAAYIFFKTFITDKPALHKLGLTIARTSIVAIIAAIVAAQALSTLITTQVKSVTGMEENLQSKQERWDWATQWSLPKIETLRVIIPGLFGYRMDTPDGGAYWGTVGQTPGWDQHHQGIARYSGAGVYAGIFVFMIAAWAIAQACRQKHSAFSATDQLHILFWTIVAIISLLLAYGRHAPFYQFVFYLPYFSTIRNPIKFMHPFSLAVVILFAYGTEGLKRLYIDPTISSAQINPIQHIKKWWQEIRGFDRRWIFGMASFFVLALIGAMMYKVSTRNIVEYLISTGFDEQSAKKIISFSLGEVLHFLAFFAVGAFLLTLILSRYFSRSKVNLVFSILAFLMIVDFARANSPWVIYWNYKQKYASNPVIDFLKNEPYSHRVVMPRFQLPQNLSFFPVVYNEWLQHHFQYYNIQSLDIIQMPRAPKDYSQYYQILGDKIVRVWELTNTKYILTLAGYTDLINSQLDPVQKRFKVHTYFTFVANNADNGISVVTNSEGPFAIVEFSGALPRALVYHNWQCFTNDQQSLETLASLNFEPAKSVLVSQILQDPPSRVTNLTSEVQYEYYSPKKIKLKAKLNEKGILLLNDRYDPNWIATVDYKPTDILRCNFLMRGVILDKGEHIVEFQFKPPTKFLYVSLAGIGLAFVMICFLCISKPEKISHA